MRSMEAGRGKLRHWPGTVPQTKPSKPKCQAGAPSLVFFATFLYEDEILFRVKIVFA